MMKNSIYGLILIIFSLTVKAGTASIDLEIESVDEDLCPIKGILTIKSNSIYGIFTSEFSLNKLKRNELYLRTLDIDTVCGEKIISQPTIHLEIKGTQNSCTLAQCHYEGQKINNLTKIRICFNRDFTCGGAIDLIANPSEDKRYWTWRLIQGVFHTYDE